MEIFLASGVFLRYNTLAFPGVAQLVARVVWDHEAAGSIPVTRTNKQEFFLMKYSCLFCCYKEIR